MRTPNDILKKTAIILVPVLMLSLGWAVVVEPIRSYYGDLDADLETKRDVVLRYKRLIGQREQLQADVSKLTGDKSLRDLFFLAANENAGAALLQQRISALVSMNGGQMRVARVETASKANSSRSFSVNLTFAISTVGLFKTLLQVEGQRPLMFVDLLSIRGGPALARAQQSQTPQSPLMGPMVDEPVLDVTLTVSGHLMPKE